MSKGRLPAEERRQQIIEQAAKVFARRGFEGTRTRDIAEECGVNEALLYRHFPSKEDLYRKALMHAYDEATSEWGNITSSDMDGLHTLIEVLKHNFRLLAETPILCANMWHGVATTTHDPVLREMIRTRLEDHHKLLLTLIDKGVKDGSIKYLPEPDFAAWRLRGLAWCFMLQSIINSDTEDSQFDWERYMQIILYEMEGKGGSDSIINE